MNNSSNQIRRLTPNDPLFPESLKKIKSPPKVLYFIGNLELKNKFLFAIVGTRTPSDYGKKVVIDFANLDRIYPKENLKLAKEIIQKQGALVSEYPPLTPPNHFHFPERNRIIAGLSKGVLVIEAREKSGALITADWAFSQKKPVFAIPGSIYNETSKGCHLLIKKGAKLVSSPKEILKFFGISFEQKSGSIEGTEEEKLIFQLLLDKTLHIDEIIQLSKLNPSKVLQTISKLELEGKIKNLGGNIFTAIS